MIDLIGHAAYVTLFVGQLLVARRLPLGWMLRLAGEFAWIGIGLELGLSSVVVWGCIFAALDIAAFTKWKPQHDHHETAARR